MRSHRRVKLQDTLPFLLINRMLCHSVVCFFEYLATYAITIDPL